MTTADDLLARCAAHGVSLRVRGVKLFATPPTLPADLANELRDARVEVVAAIRLTAPCVKCGSLDYIQRAIHAGRSIARDCARCHYFRGFDVWNPPP